MRVARPHRKEFRRCSARRAFLVLAHVCRVVGWKWTTSDPWLKDGRRVMTMVSNYWRIVSLPVLVTALGSPLLIDCGKMPGGIPGAPAIPGAPGNCPDMANVDAIANFDWQKEFKL